jgi:hypothetical protein
LEIDLTAALPPAPPRFPFTGTPSDFTENDSSDVMEYINKIIDDDLVNIVITETNRYDMLEMRTLLFGTTQTVMK